MLEVSVLHQPLNMETNVVVVMAAVGKNVSVQHPQRNAFKMFQIVNGFIQKIFITFKHIKLVV